VLGELEGLSIGSEHLLPRSLTCCQLVVVSDCVIGDHLLMEWYATLKDIPDHRSISIAPVSPTKYHDVTYTSQISESSIDSTPETWCKT
jgi:hypothetical protein